MSDPWDYKVLIEFAGDPLEIDCECGSCDWKGKAAFVDPIEHAVLTPGDPSPAGRCPECGSLAYVSAKGDDAPKVNLHHSSMTPARIVAAAINHFGDAEHPYADSDTISGFFREYAIECCEKARSDGWPRIDEAIAWSNAHLSPLNPT